MDGQGRKQELLLFSDMKDPKTLQNRSSKVIVRERHENDVDEKIVKLRHFSISSRLYNSKTNDIRQ